MHGLFPRLIALGSNCARWVQSEVQTWVDHSIATARLLLDDGRPAGAHRRLQPPAIAQLNLRGQQLLDRIGRGQNAAVDIAQDRVKCLQRARQP
jgi:hypothetical protein